MPSVVDAHVHLLDLLQQGEGAGQFLSALDRAGADRAVVFGMAVKKRWAAGEPRRPGYHLDDNSGCYSFSLTDALVANDLRELAPGQRARLAPTVCGFDVTDLLAIEHLERVWDSYDGWAGIGELLLRHDDLTNPTQGEPATIAHPALEPVLDFARAHGVPVAVHQDSSSAGRPGEHEYVPELASALARHPRTTVVWCHAGISRRIEPRGQVRVLAELVAAHPGLHVDLSSAVADHVVPDGHPDPAWVGLIDARPDRFVLGSDVFGRPAGLGEALARFEPLLAALAPSTRAAVAGDNAMRLWFGG
ncbi:MAG: hypothetical protein QOC93_1567 [Actinomycetota bacterium]|jgi:hypothetical protein|nr:hypothetical protein [Actinomycetota bacterium]